MMFLYDDIKSALEQLIKADVLEFSKAPVVFKPWPLHHTYVRIGPKVNKPWKKKRGNKKRRKNKL